MEINFFELLGTTGSLILCASAVPQIIKTYRMKCADGLSGSYLVILFIGMALIQVYALHVKDMVFICGNGMAIVLTGILMGLWCLYSQCNSEGRESFPQIKKNEQIDLTFE